MLYGWYYAIGIILIATVITIIMIIKKNKTNNASIETVIGEKCIVTEKIDNLAGCGEARVKGCIWSARGSGENDIFEAGETLTVVAIEGVKLICKK